MKKTCLFKKSVFAVTVALASQQALAAGFQLNSQSATGLGRAFAGDAVIADNASVMSKNAAAMALFDETALSLGFVSITSLIEVKDATYTNAAGSASGASYDDAGDTNIAPNIHLIVPVNKKFAYGLNAYSNFGTKTEFSDTYIAAEFGGTTDVKSVNIGLAGSYRIDDQWSVGAGVDAIYGQGTMKRNLSDNFSDATSSNPIIAYLSTLNGTNSVDIDKADGWAVGFNLGTVYEMDENNRFGLSYRYSPKLVAEDDEGQEITLPLPDMAEFSGYHRIENTKFAVHYSAQWIKWSEFDKITFENSTISEKAYNWKDAYHISLGGTYYLNETWTLRAGYMYDESAQDETTSISVPDSDRNWFSAGFTYQLNRKSNIDFGFTYLIGEDVEVEEATDYTGITATTHADAILFGLQYSRSF